MSIENSRLKHAEWQPGWKRRAGVVTPVLLAVCLAVTPAACVGFASTMWWKNHPVVVEKVKTVVREVAPKTAADDEDIMVVAHSLVDAGYTDLQASAVCGNLWAESHGQADALERGVSDEAPTDKTNSAVRQWATDHAGGIGLMQWTGARATQLLDWMDANGRDWRDASAQAEFLKQELNDSSQWTADKEAWLDAVDVKTAASVIEDDFVRPADPDSTRGERTKAALAVYSALQSDKTNVKTMDSLHLPD